MVFKFKILLLSAIPLMLQVGFGGEPVPDYPEEQPDGISVNSVLTLEHSLLLTEKFNLELQSDALEYYSRDEQAKQSGVYLNPEVEADFENFAGSGEYSGLQSLETSIGLKQEFEFGDKRGKRLKTGEAYRNISAWDYETNKRKLRIKVVESYLDILAGQEKLILLKDTYRLQQDLLEYSIKRHELGKAPITEKLKATIQLSLTHMELDKVTSELNVTKKNLATLWNSSSVKFDSAAGNLFEIIPIPDESKIIETLDEQPGFQKLASEKKYLNQVLNLEHSQQVPNLGVGIGSKYDASVGDVALKVSASMGIPVWNRNKAGIKSVEYQIKRNEKQRKSHKIQTLMETAEKYTVLRSLQEALEHLEKEIIPEAEKAELASLESYKSGRLGQLDVYDSQHILFDVRLRYIEIRVEYLKNLAMLEQLCGINIIHFNK